MGLASVVRSSATVAERTGQNTGPTVDQAPSTQTRCRRLEKAVGVGFGVRRAYRLKDGGVEQDRWCEVSRDDPALVTALLVYRWGSQAPAEALGPYLPELRVRGLIEPCT